MLVEFKDFKPVSQIATYVCVDLLCSTGRRNHVCSSKGRIYWPIDLFSKWYQVCFALVASILWIGHCLRQMQRLTSGCRVGFDWDKLRPVLIWQGRLHTRCLVSQSHTRPSNSCCTLPFIPFHSIPLLNVVAQVMMCRYDNDMIKGIYKVI